MTTAIDSLVAVVVMNTRDPPTNSAANFPREQVFAASLPLGVAALGGVELLLIDKGGVEPREPVR